MSCDWDVECVTCGKRAGISDTNHLVELMLWLVAHAPMIKSLFESLRGVRMVWADDLRISGRSIPVDFFIEHGDHVLRPVNEYGELDGDCRAEWYCPPLGKVVRCSRREHPRQPGAHYHCTEDHSVHHVEDGVPP